MAHKKKILVTGGAGYIGSVLVPILLRHGYDVKVFDKLLFGDFGLEKVKRNIEIIQGDIMEPPSNLMEGVDAVIHLAGLSSQGLASYDSPRYTDKVNHIGTEIIATMSKHVGIKRFVFASSCSIYCTYKHTPITEAPLYGEDDFLEIFAPYALSKKAAEEALLEMTDQNFQPVILRKGTLYGYSPKMRYDLVVNSFTKDAFSTGKINVNAGGEIYRPMVDIQDVVRAYIQALEMPDVKVGGQIFNVVKKNQKIGDLAIEFKNALKELYGIDILIDTKPFEVVLNYMADDKKFKSIFEYKPTREMKDVIAETWQALEEGSQYADPKYYNEKWHPIIKQKGLL